MQDNAAGGLWAYLSVIGFAGAEQGAQGIVAWHQESGKVDEEFAGDVEEDEEGVDAGQSEEGIDLWDGSLLLEVVEGWVLGELEGELRVSLSLCEVHQNSPRTVPRGSEG